MGWQDVRLNVRIDSAGCTYCAASSTPLSCSAGRSAPSIAGIADPRNHYHQTSDHVVPKIGNVREVPATVCHGLARYDAIRLTYWARRCMQAGRVNPMARKFNELVEKMAPDVRARAESRASENDRRVCAR